MKHFDFLALGFYDPVGFVASICALPIPNIEKPTCATKKEWVYIRKILNTSFTDIIYNGALALPDLSTWEIRKPGEQTSELLEAKLSRMRSSKHKNNVERAIEAHNAELKAFLQHIYQGPAHGRMSVTQASNKKMLQTYFAQFCQEEGIENLVFYASDFKKH